MKALKLITKAVSVSPTWKVLIMDGLAGVSVSVKVAEAHGSTVMVSEVTLLP